MDFNDDFFDWDDSEEDDDPEETEQEDRNRRVRNLPVLKKAREILTITEAIVATIDREKDVLMMHEQMLGNAMMLPPKIVGAEGGDLYTLRMENAVLIKIHARELLTQTTYCKVEQLADPAHLQLLRDEIENFRELFVDWINGFDKSNDVPDQWGLFY